jgi:hypothetical protein
MERTSSIVWEIPFPDGGMFRAKHAPPVASFGIYIDVLGDFIGEVAIVRVFTV